MKPKLFVSFSGGRSSAYMLKRLFDEYQDQYELKVAFANTGQENEKTLVFVERCSSEWGIEVVWVEAVVHPGEEVACTHKIVDFHTASRLGEPFEEVIKKYGIPNQAYKHCNRELKLNTMSSYLNSIGWQDSMSAVGIRNDEPKRFLKDYTRGKIVHPMVQWFPTAKWQINDFWEEQPFQLGLEEHQGNCTWCWKKSLLKHVMIANETPEVYEFPRRMEELYGLNGHNLDGNRRVFFRGNTSTDRLIQIAQQAAASPLFDRDEDAGCSESCEAFT